ncbi:HDIG domain-containing protein [Clostridium sp. MSJ-11]|uniref:HDIG domain-containing protein n=1 Tax=Clostridium mobile TaxID=2841512 RepID=A0ABS6EFU3_9CLOT|nr:HDIG domain-containing metalloprotein [Clostridium mobile]MBU5483637.1 HDIG domain-containing protein [Clostridium mobile]
MDKNKIFEEFNIHLLNDSKPSMYFNDISEKEEYKEIYPLNFLWDLKETDQNLTHHPEGTVWNHTMLVLDQAAKFRHLSEEPRVFMWAALLHDIGKAPTTKVRKGKITSYNHDKVGQNMAVIFLKELMLIEDSDFIYKVADLVRWHMQPLFIVKNMPFAEIDRMLEEVSADEIALLAICDRVGRGKMTDEKAKEEIDSIERFLLRAKERAKKLEYSH